MGVEAVTLQVNEPNITAKVMDGEAIIIDLSTGVYYSLDGVGGLVWSGIEAGQSSEAILQSIVDAHDVALDQAEQDLALLLEDLKSAGLVVPANGTGAVAPAASGSPGVRTPYQPPRLNRYEDMAELFALDPPLPDSRKAG